MKATVEDFDVLKAIQPLQAIAYLQANGWHERKRIADKASVWIRETNSEKQFQILLPLDRELEDFPLRMSKVLQTLEIAEQRSQLEILSDLATSLADITRIRVDHPSAVDGSIPLYDGVHLFKYAGNMIMWAACSAVEPRAYFQGRRFGEVDEYLRKVRIGQTERGSYVLNIISPIVTISDIAEEREVSPSLQDPFERKVIKSLAQALAAIQTASEEALSTGNLEPFNDTVEEGVSANLCQVIVDMNHSGGDRGLEIDFRWSPKLVKPDIRQEIILPAHAMPVIKEAGQFIKNNRQKRARRRQAYQNSIGIESEVVLVPKFPERLGVRGLVVGLERLDGSETGKVTIMGSINGEHRKIEVELNDLEYSLAVQAHQERIPVICYGKLSKEGDSFILKNPQDFAVEPNALVE